MATATCYEMNGNEAGTVELPESLFGGKVNEGVVHQAVVAYLANQRQGTVNTKERSDVRGGGRKPYRQKGTGRARAGTIRSPIFRGGGTVFGPHPRDHRHKMTRKMKRLALTSSLTTRAGNGDVVVVKELQFDEPKTSRMAGLLKNINEGGKTLLVIDAANEAIVKSARNIPRVKVCIASNLTTYDVVWADKIVVTSAAVTKMEEVFAS